MVPRSTNTELSSAPLGGKIVGRKITKRPASNFKLQGNCYLLTIATPNYRRENFELKVVGNILYINASRNNGPLCQFGRSEYLYANWDRSFVLPVDADPIMASARYQNGELKIVFAKSDNPLSHVGEYKIYVY